MDIKQHFQSFNEAKEYAKAHPGWILRRNPDGNGWIVFKKVWQDKNNAKEQAKNKKPLSKSKNLSYNDDVYQKATSASLLWECRALSDYYDYGEQSIDEFFDETLKEIYSDSFNYSRSEEEGWFYPD